MALVKLQFRPGVNRDQTNYSGEGGWWDGDKIRFRSGFPEKIGGWVRAATDMFIGTCRNMWIWVTTFSDEFLAVGTNIKLYIVAGGLFYDITPLRTTDPTLTTPDTDDAVATLINTTTVTMNLGVAHGADTGSYVTISGVTGTIGGVPDSEINANHKITVINADSFSFTVTTTATSTVAAGGGTAIIIDFELAPGNATATAGYGWGSGAWGRNSWGSGSDQPIFLPPRDWWEDNFDNDAVFNIRNGSPYYWVRGTSTDPQSALATRAVLLSAVASDDGYDPDAVPVKVMQLLVSQQDKHLLAFGAVPFGSTSAADFDPLLIRWSDQDNPGQWTPTPTNSAGFIRVSRGSFIVRALPARQEILTWTNTNLYTLQFTGTTDVYAVQEYADNISIISPRACTNAGNVTYWMGHDKFYVYNGRVDTLNCTLRNYVFRDINSAQSIQVVCGTSEEWNEVWWFYPSASSDFNDRYVVYNYLEQLWYYGQLSRDAWLDTPLRPGPISTYTDSSDDTSGLVFNQESGVDADGEPLEAYIQSNDFDLADGEQFMLSKRIIPDVGFSGSTASEPEVTLTILSRNFPGNELSQDTEDSQVVTETSVGIYTQQIFIRARARQMALKISSEDLGVQWQLGSPRIDARRDGKR